MSESAQRARMEEIFGCVHDRQSSRAKQRNFNFGLLTSPRDSWIFLVSNWFRHVALSSELSPKLHIESIHFPCAVLCVVFCLPIIGRVGQPVGCRANGGYFFDSVDIREKFGELANLSVCFVNEVIA